MSRGVRFLFAHGWSFDATFWNAVRDRLPDADTGTVERGYLGAAPRSPAAAPGCIAVGHSAGTLDLLADLPVGCRGLVAINGFTRFTAAADFPHGVPGRLLARMLGRLAADPAAGVAEFRTRCGGVPDQAGPLRPDRLRDGLLRLREQDARCGLRFSGLRVLALAGALDRIATPAMTRDCFDAAATRWHPAGGHLLPLTDPDWCAEQLRFFAG